MSSVSLEEAQHKLPELIAGLRPGDELMIDQGGAPLAKLVRAERSQWPCQPGSAKHIPHWMAPDFNAPVN